MPARTAQPKASKTAPPLKSSYHVYGQAAADVDQPDLRAPPQDSARHGQQRSFSPPPMFNGGYNNDFAPQVPYSQGNQFTPINAYYPPEQLPLPPFQSNMHTNMPTNNYYQNGPDYYAPPPQQYQPPQNSHHVTPQFQFGAGPGMNGGNGNAGNAGRGGRGGRGRPPGNHNGRGGRGGGGGSGGHPIRGGVSHFPPTVFR